MSQRWILTMLEMQTGVSQWHVCERPCLKWTHFRPEKPISLTSRVVLSFYRRAQWASLLRQLLLCASIFTKWISWFGSRLMRGSGAPQIAVMRQMFGRLEWRQERKSRSGGTDAQNRGKGPTPCRQTLLTSWQSGEKQGPDGEGERKVEGQPQPHVKCWNRHLNSASHLVSFSSLTLLWILPSFSAVSYLVCNLLPICHCHLSSSSYSSISFLSFA